MEVELFHTPILLPGLIAEEIQLQKHLKENNLSNPVSKCLPQLKVVDKAQTRLITPSLKQDSPNFTKRNQSLSLINLSIQGDPNR